MADIEEGTEVIVGNGAPAEAGTVGVVKTIRRGWGSQNEAVIVVQGWREREFTVPLGDISAT